MKYETAFKKIQEMMNGIPNEALDTSLKAISKQIGIKPRYHKLNDGSYMEICAFCKTDISGCEYCSICGQKINWGEGE